MKWVFVCCCMLIVVIGHSQILSDPTPTRHTAALYRNLHSLSKQYTLLGHQDDLAYGVGWKYINGKSDVKYVVDDYPAVYGWDLARIELDKKNNIDNVPFTKMRSYILEGYKRGSVITLSWHFDNPLTGGSAWDTTHGAMTSILPGGSKHLLYKSWLDKATVFLQSLSGDKGEAIPILFRPFHELTGNWFWWCKNTCTADEFKQVWRFTIDYLRKEKKLHNLIIVYNTAGFANEEEFLERYPGDDVVDMVSFDMYQQNGQSRQGFIDTMRYEMEHLVNIAKQKNKPAALAETGLEAIPDSNWWTQTLLPILKDFPVSYVLLWRNAGYMPSMKKMHYYVPYKGQVSASDFKKFYNSGRVLFEKRIRQQKIYE